VNADKSINKALEVYRSDSTLTVGYKAVAFNNAATLASRKGNHKRAISLSLDAIRLENTQGSDNKNIQRYYHNISEYYRSLGDFNNSISNSKKSLTCC